MILLRFYALALAVVASLAVAAHLRRDRETLVRLATLAALFTGLLAALALGVFGVAALAAALAIFAVTELAGTREPGPRSDAHALVAAGAMLVLPAVDAAALPWLLALISLATGASLLARLARAQSIDAWTEGLATLHACCGLAAMIVLARQDVARLLALLMMLQFNDGVAYLVGRRFGKRRLAPRVSPNKTVEGLAGGVLGVALIAALTRSPLLPVFTDFPFDHALGLVVIVSGLGVGGDLLYSLIKRRAGLDDFDSRLPGHGGVLDRVDSLVAAAPLVAAWNLLRG